MAKFDQARIGGTADEYADGTSGIEPLCDGQGVPFVKIEPSDAVSAAAAALGGWSTHLPITVPDEPNDAQRLPDVECSEIKLVADRGNTKTIYHGDEDVSSINGQDMQAREAEIVTRVSNANEFYVIAAAGDTGQKLRYFTR